MERYGQQPMLCCRSRRKAGQRRDRWKRELEDAETKEKEEEIDRLLPVNKVDHLSEQHGNCRQMSTLQSKTAERIMTKQTGNLDEQLPE